MFKKGEDYYDYNKILTREELSEKVTELMKEVNQLKKEVSKLKDNKKERIWIEYNYFYWNNNNYYKEGV